MHTPRVILVATVLAAAAAASVVRGQAQQPEKPMEAVKVKDGLVVLRGPFNRCAPNGCGAYKDDGVLHEAGDVAIRVTPQGLIVVDDKYEENAAEVLARIQKISRARWERTVSTVAFKGGLKGYYAEMEAQLR